MIIDDAARLSANLTGLADLPLGLPAPDHGVPHYANTLESFRTQPSFGGNLVPQDSKVIEGEVVERLLRNFNVFEEPSSPGTITVGTLMDIVSGRKSGISADNIELAKMIFIMPGLLSKLDSMNVFNKVDLENLNGIIDRRTLEQLDIYHAPLRNARRAFFRTVVF
ncbi:hypothetical protein AYK59_24735 [Pseudomonas synxantha]|uniref:hypothetical protein n=2 Tax=Pseudomonas fluorescens group TaxID=136843 RepID=UPI0006149908|nr:hypothetical protein [Pseudomonas synxantha]AMS23183.1 hypothetical protein AYK59_24735 [Pseudomonas synxantha]WDG41132.1 hypothetical protein PUP72_21145 [Pseudomonas synxantha]